MCHTAPRGGALGCSVALAIEVDMEVSSLGLRRNDDIALESFKAGSGTGQRDGTSKSIVLRLSCAAVQICKVGLWRYTAWAWLQ
mmetsp:Transcript_30048/g.75674  ORF Transcript_30048/g.75674 Transcript_30048/m.75674 type:complete len:84 (-) Transcript_30048:257-508(-)